MMKKKDLEAKTKNKKNMAKCDECKTGELKFIEVHKCDGYNAIEFLCTNPSCKAEIHLETKKDINTLEQWEKQRK